MELSDFIPVILPIILFFTTLFIIFILRAKDKKNRGITNVKKLMEMYKADIDSSDAAFKQYATELEQTVAKKDVEVKELIQTVNSQLGELRSYSEDLVRLKAAMDTYREALEGLAKLTSDADDKVELVQNEVDRLDKVRTVIDGFQQDMKDADEHLRKHEQRVIQLEKESIARMNTAVSETDSSMDEAMAGLHKESQEVFDEFKEKTEKDTEFRLRKLDDAFQAVIKTVQEFFGELENKLEVAQNAADRLDDLTGSEHVVFQEEPKLQPMQTPKMESPFFQTEPDVQFSPKPEFKPHLEQEEEEQTESSPAEEDEFEPEPDPSFPPMDEAALKDMEIMDMDFDATEQDEPEADAETLPDWARKSKPASRWETFGDEEVVSFDDEPLKT